jgi:hypothetical protein
MIEMIDPVFYDILRKELGLGTSRIDFLKAERFISESKQRAEDTQRETQKQAETGKKMEEFYRNRPHLRPSIKETKTTQKRRKRQKKRD